MKKFTHDPDVFYKFGKTYQFDANNRFKVETAKSHGFKNVPLGEGYVPNTIWSRIVPVEVADKLEALFKKKIPKNIWTRVKYNGITECRVLTQEEVDSILDDLSKQFPEEKYNKMRMNHIRIYFTKFTKIYETQYDDS